MKYEVYIPIVDTGVDFIIEPPGKDHKFIGIQVKTSSFQSKSGWWLWSITKDDRRKLSSFFYVLCLEDIGFLPLKVLDKIEGDLVCFIVPYSKLAAEIEKRSKAWALKGEFSLSINRQSFDTGRSGWLDFLMPYLNNWNILK